MHLRHDSVVCVMTQSFVCRASGHVSYRGAVCSGFVGLFVSDESYHIWTSHVTYDWVMARTWIRHHMPACLGFVGLFASAESYHTWLVSRDRVMAHTWIRHHMRRMLGLFGLFVNDESCHISRNHATYGCVRSRMHIWTSHVTSMNKSGKI